MSLQNIRDRINDLHRTLSWRQIAELDEYKGLSFATISAIARGREPKKAETCKILRLPAPVTVMAIGDVANNAQATNSRQCACGQAFIPNHPKRHKCYSCSPIKGNR